MFSHYNKVGSWEVVYVVAGSRRIARRIISANQLFMSTLELYLFNVRVFTNGSAIEKSGY